MLKKLSLRAKLLTAGILLTVVPLVIVSIMVFVENDKMVQAASEESDKLAYTDLDHVAQGVYRLCRTQQEVLQQNVNYALNVARDVLKNMGQVHFAKETATWSAVNQYTKEVSQVKLPRMQVAQTWLGQNFSMQESSPVVDKTKALVGGTCTIFQRMNENGDMLRVCTNVQKKDGTRAIGTYIPRTNPDGTPNPVISTIMQGKTFEGRAYVVNKWYITAYEPIFNKEDRVVGVLYVGVPQESATSLRQAIMETEIGKTGYVYVLDSKGNYVISKGGRRDGENIWNATDADGDLFIQDLCQKAVTLKPGELGEARYPWKNTGDTAPREKIVRLMYFEPWDWIIGVGSYLDEFQAAQRRVTAIGHTSDTILIGVLAASLILAAAVWFFISRGIAGKITRIVAQLTEGSEQVASASGQVSSASQSLAEGATEQAAGLEETSSSLEEMASMTKQNADNAQQANTLATEARKAANDGSESMGRMNTAIQDIQKSSDETAKIIKVIDEIAFQTNLLALNAAVEAARAGEAGKGFAVVAEEVRNLAMRSAEAAKNTASMIEESVKNSKNGVDIATEVSKVLDEIVQGVGKTTDLVGEIAAASQEQAQGIDQVNTAVAQMDKVTQQNAANAEQSASASEELSAQAGQMNHIVAELAQIVSGNRQRSSGHGANQRHKSRRFAQSDSVLHTIADGGPNCWERKNCGRIPGGDKVDSLGVCPAYPDRGRDCWRVAGTFCGGEVQGSAAQKLMSCTQCDFYKHAKRNSKSDANAATHNAIPLDDDEQLRHFNA